MRVMPQRPHVRALTEGMNDMFDLMGMRHLSYEGPVLDDKRTLRRLPGALRDILRTINGFIAFDGGFHMRGACREPSWHSIAAAMQGEHAIHRLFAPVSPADIPFAQDALGDQFLLREDGVWRLRAETATMIKLDQDLDTFFATLQREPLEVLDMDPLIAYRRQAGHMPPGHLLQVEPPFCLQEQVGAPVKLSVAEVRVVLERLSQLAAKVNLTPEGLDLFDLVR